MSASARGLRYWKKGNSQLNSRSDIVTEVNARWTESTIELQAQ